MTTHIPLKKVDDRGCIFSVIGTSESIPQHVINTLRQAAVMECAVIGGGVKGLSQADAKKMMPWVKAGFRDFTGVVVSGGTAYVDPETGELLSDVVTAVPAVLAAQSPCIGLGFFPRVEEFAFDRTLHYLFTDKYGSVVDDRYHHICAIQQNASDVLDWDGDLKQRFTLIDSLQDWSVVYLIINGGAVTRDEAYMAIEHNIPVVVARGSGREADALVAAVESGDFTLTAAEQRAKAGSDATKVAAVDGIVEKCKSTLKGREHLVHVVDYGDGEALRAVLKELGLFSEDEAA